jgi:hypothetical protein
MAHPNKSSSQTPAYLQGSPIGQVLTWAAKRKGLSNNQKSGAEQRPPHDESKTRRCAVIEEASTGTSDAMEDAPGEKCPVEAQSNTKPAAGQERHSEAHDWSLARRIVMAGIICLYT